MNDENAVEKWGKIDGHEFFEVSNIGRVRSTDRTVKFSDGRVFHYKGKILEGWKGKSGYRMVTLTRPIKQYYVHHLVAKAFLPTKPQGRNVGNEARQTTTRRLQNKTYTKYDGCMRLVPIPSSKSQACLMLILPPWEE